MRFGDWDDYDYRYFPPSVPRAAKGGIRSQSKRGSFGENWWAKRWIAVLEGFNIGSRLQRGRSYARSGQVVSLDIKEGRSKLRYRDRGDSLRSGNHGEDAAAKIVGWRCRAGFEAGGIRFQAAGWNDAE